MPQWVADKIQADKAAPAAAPAVGLPTGQAPAPDPPGPVATSAYNKVVVIAMPAALISQAGEGKSEEWALDTGAAYDIANEKVPGRRSQVAVCDRIWTAGGVVTSNETVYRDDVIPGEAINARVLPNTPNALKVGARCAVEGYGSFWHPLTRKACVQGARRHAHRVRRG